MRAIAVITAVLTGFSVAAQDTICNPLGNVAIFSNYDGGGLTINVDADIPDLHIGVVSYEFAVINIVGPYVSNVSAVWWAGYNGTNDHCGTGSLAHATSIQGAPGGTAQVQVYPPATLMNTNGNASIICAYSCDIDQEQGGCNTVDQIAHYFLSNWGGTLLFHRTQYGCWDGTWSISEGGNCCIDPLSTAVAGIDQAPLDPYLDGNGEWLVLGHPASCTVLDAQGRCVASTGTPTTRIRVGALPAGAYLLRAADGRAARFVLSR